MSLVERELRRMWRGEGGVTPTVLAALAAPAAVAFGAGARGRNALYDLGILAARRAPMPVVSVGNLAVGGTGKTPVAAWVVRQLETMGWKPALVSRGYGEDELQLHHQWNPDTPVIRSPRRIAGAGRAHEGERDVVVLDDGFQHRGIARDVDIVLLSPAHPFPVRLLPRGPYREGLDALRRADYVLITAKGSHELDAAEKLAELVSQLGMAPGIAVFPLRAGSWRALEGFAAECPPGEPLAVTSVAEPDGFLRLLREACGEPVAHLRFPDHHRFARSDAERIRRETGDGWVATTEKDAVKLRSLQEYLPTCRVLPLIPDPPPGLEVRILGRLRRRETKERSG